ncbi:Similar to hypothetical protein [Podospora anserina S mat+]; acc. no. XP_001903708 [Pyronema omphalodes CBS 100304]|uniref:Prolamin-like domain-containing protein n=1 Tax=Pyronema omphalodes (strain CBS 100304) TaxID=1076935 RepID=U4LEQ6_PYROM|nr:Similar to hypothetical protein [Podospora anserina S mat+]; acc. no. XP_001903708 [Pyronema omphalodes CBS 100304]
MEPVSTLTFLFLFFLSLFKVAIAAPTTPDVQPIATGPSPDPSFSFSAGVAVDGLYPDKTSSNTAWGNGVKLHYCKHPDWVKCLKYASANENICYNMDWMWNDSVTSYEVNDGCCVFFENFNCQKPMFSAFNRKHGKIGPWHNDMMSSYRCAKHYCPE